MTSKPRSYGKNDDSGGGRTQENYEKKCLFYCIIFEKSAATGGGRTKHKQERTIKKAALLCNMRKTVAGVNGIKKSKRTDKKASASLHNLRKNNERGIDRRKRMMSKSPPYCAIYGKSNSKRKSGQASRCLSKSPISSNSSIIRSILRFLLSAAGAAAASRPASEICGATVFIVPSFSSF